MSTQQPAAQPQPLSDERATRTGETLRTTADGMEQVIHGKRRVIELISGQIVRDERQGGYQTQAVPVQGFGRMTEEVAP